MKIHRLIFRYDFKNNLAGVIDGSGALIAKYLEPLCAQHKGELGADFLRRMTSMNITQEGKTHLNFTMEPRTLFCEMESVAGVDFRQLSSNADFSLVTKLADHILDDCSATAIQRFGFRAFVLGKGGDSFSSNLVTMRGKLAGALVTSVEEHLGKVADIAYSFDGTNIDGVKYHARLGPYSKTEAGKYFSKLVDAIKDEDSHFWIADIDVYDENFERTVSTMKRCDSLIKKIQRLAEKFDETLAQGSRTESH